MQNKNNKRSNNSKITKQNIVAINRMCSSFQNGLRAGKSIEQRKWLDSKGFDLYKLELGYNSGQFHHRMSQKERLPYIEAGILKRVNVGVNRPDSIPYNSFAKEAITFPLKNIAGDTVNMYGVRIKLKSPECVFLNQHGVYPEVPHKRTERLFVCQNVLDCATVIQSNVLENRDAVLSLMDGEINADTEEVINSLKNLKEIVWVGRTSDSVKEKFESISQAEIDVQENLNDIFIKEGEDALEALLFGCQKQTKKQLEKLNPVQLGYKGCEFYFTINGNIANSFSDLKVSLTLEDYHTRTKYRNKIDLFATEKIEKWCVKLSEEGGYNGNLLKEDFRVLTDLLEEYRDELVQSAFPQQKRNLSDSLTIKEKEQVNQFLERKDLLDAINKKLEDCGIVGEENTRLLLFIIAISYKTPYQLHGLVQASSGSGKSHLINTVVECLPYQDVLDITRATSKSFYNFTENELVDKCMVIQDLDGLDEKALLPLRELQSNGRVTSSVTGKNPFGENQTTSNAVNAKFSSLIATTNLDIYADNFSRSVVVGVDESSEQNRRITEFQNKLFSGEIDKNSIREAKTFLRNLTAQIKPFEVVNKHYANIQIPDEIKNIRRLNEQLQNFIALITILHQHQRKTDSQGRLIATKEDVKNGIDILFDSIVLKVDELSSPTRQFYEELKSFLREKGKLKKEFTQREIREGLRRGKTMVSKYINELLELEYIAKSSGSENRGVRYVLEEDSNLEKLKNQIKEGLAFG